MVRSSISFCEIARWRSNRPQLVMTVDEGFREFYYWCKANDVPVIIVSRYVRCSSSAGSNR